MSKGKKRKKNRRAAEKHISILDVFQNRICVLMNTYSLDEITAENTSDGLEVSYSEYADNCIIGSNIEIPELSELLQSSMPKLNITELYCTRCGNVFDFEICFTAAQMPCNVLADISSAAENKKHFAQATNFPQSV